MSYDAEIRVGTKVDTSQMQKLQIQINKTTDKVARLTKEMSELKNAKIPTDDYKEVQKQIDVTETKLNKLLEKKESFNGSRKSTSWLNLNGEIEKLQNSLPYLKGELQDLVDTGKAFTLGKDTAEYSKLSQELVYARESLQALSKRQDELIAKQSNSTENFKKMVSSAKKAFSALSGGIQSGFEKVKNAAKKAFGAINKDAKKTNGLLATMRSRMHGLALSLLIFNQVTKAFNAMMSGAKEGISEFAKYSKDCNAVLSDFKSSLQTMKYSLGAAFAPIIQVIVPYLAMLINALNSAISKISQFFAVLTGNSTYYRAIKQQVDFAGSLEDTANAAKEAAGALAGFDKLNVVKQQENTGGSGSTGSGSGGEFEEVPVESGIKELAQKVKEIFAELFAPMKEAWEREGQFVIDSWKSALNEIWALVKDIGRDFLIVWNQEETVNVFEDILHIIGDIGLVTANLATNFREAWNENQTGLHILENIRDIFAVIVDNIRDAADFTVEWSKNINFIPLLTKIEQWTESLNAVFDSLSGVATDFYKQVLLPLAQWSIEEGLPDLLQIFIDFNNAVDWEELRSRLSEFWDVLEPFAETVGEGLIQFIGDLSQKIADFTKSETFENMLNWLEEKMDGATPDDIAKGIEKIAKAFIFFKIAGLGLNALTAITPAVSTVKSFMDIFSGGKGAAVAGEMTTVANALGGLKGAISDIAVATGAFLLVQEPVKDGFVDLLGDITGDTETAEKIKKEYDGLTGIFKAFKDDYEAIKNKINGLPFLRDDADTLSAFNVALKDIGDGVIYTDEQLKKMQGTWKLTDEDVESLRQEMLDMNPELREVADGFGLFDASAETLRDVYYSLRMVDDGLYDSETAFSQFQEPTYKATEEAKNFFAQLDNGEVELNDFQTSLLESAGYSQEFINSVNGSVEGLDGFVSGVSSAGVAAGAALVEGLQSSKDSVGSTIASLGVQMATQAPEMSKQTNALGAAAVVGFNLGISKNTAESGKTVDTWMKGVEKSIHDSSMRFGSPSKTAEEFGLNTVLGYNNGVSRNVSRTITVIKSYMQTIQNTFKNIVSIMSNIGQESMNALIEGLESKQGELKKTVESMAKLMEEATMVSSKITVSASSTTKTTKKANIPHLATGSVIRGGNPFVALLGDQPAGQTNVEAPLSTIKQAVKEALRESGGGGGGEYTFIAELNGKALYKETVRQDQMFKKSTGKSGLGN